MTEYFTALSERNREGIARTLHFPFAIDETRSVGIRIYKNGHWGSAGSLGQVTHHDRSNSRP